MRGFLESCLRGYFFGIGITIFTVGALILGLFVLAIFMPGSTAPEKYQSLPITQQNVAANEPLPTPIRREPPIPLGETQNSPWIDCQDPDVSDDETISYCEEKGEPIGEEDEISEE